MRQVNPLMQTAKNDEAPRKKIDLRFTKNHYTGVWWARVVMNEQTGTAQPPDYGSDV